MRGVIHQERLRQLEHRLHARVGDSVDHRPGKPERRSTDRGCPRASLYQHFLMYLVENRRPHPLPSLNHLRRCRRARAITPDHLRLPAATLRAQAGAVWTELRRRRRGGPERARRYVGIAGGPSTVARGGLRSEEDGGLAVIGREERFALSRHSPTARPRSGGASRSRCRGPLATVRRSSACRHRGWRPQGRRLGSPQSQTSGRMLHRPGGEGVRR